MSIRTIAPRGEHGIIGIHVDDLEEARYVVRKLDHLELGHQALILIENSPWVSTPEIVHMGALEEWYEVKLSRWLNNPAYPAQIEEVEPLFPKAWIKAHLGMLHEDAKRRLFGMIGEGSPR